MNKIDTHTVFPKKYFNKKRHQFLYDKGGFPLSNNSCYIDSVLNVFIGPLWKYTKRYFPRLNQEIKQVYNDNWIDFRDSIRDQLRDATRDGSSMCENELQFVERFLNWLQPQSVSTFPSLAWHIVCGSKHNLSIHDHLQLFPRLVWMEEGTSRRFVFPINDRLFLLQINPNKCPIFFVDIWFDETKSMETLEEDLHTQLKEVGLHKVYCLGGVFRARTVNLFQTSHYISLLRNKYKGGYFMLDNLRTGTSVLPHVKSWQEITPQYAPKWLVFKIA